MKYSRIPNNYAVDVRTDSPEGCFTPNIVAEFVEVPDDVQDGWILTNGNWSAPVVYTPSAQEIADARAEVLAQQTTELAASIRQERNLKLSATDWTQMPDVPQAVKDIYTAYRQALRDVPAQAGFPWTVTWPDAP